MSFVVALPEKLATIALGDDAVVVPGRSIEIIECHCAARVRDRGPARVALAAVLEALRGGVAGHRAGDRRGGRGNTEGIAGRGRGRGALGAVGRERADRAGRAIAVVLREGAVLIGGA